MVYILFNALNIVVESVSFYRQRLHRYGMMKSVRFLLVHRIHCAMSMEQSTSPVEDQSAPSVQTFRQKLKTHLFRQS